MDFTDYAEARHRLQQLCEAHFASVLAFRLGKGPSFRTYLGDPDDEDRVQKEPQAWHLTSSATCLQSLVDCPAHLRPEGEKPEAAAAQFAALAIARSAWTSEDAAHIYCTCRTLPLVLGQLREPNAAVPAHFRTIFRQLDHPEPPRFAVGETNAQERWQDWYPANAFHTYWALDILDAFETGRAEQYQRLDEELRLTRKREEMRLWAMQQLCHEVALHSASSSDLDTDQLAWSLSIFVRHMDRRDELGSNLRLQDLFVQALYCLFKTQEPATGTWRHYRPLFHYQKSGNAYCYVFETFAVLLKAILERSRRTSLFLKGLEPHCEKLLRLFEYASRTAIETEVGGARTLAWGSGHTKQRRVESWATASVFDFAQAMRRVVGYWTRNAARKSLLAVVPQEVDPRGNLLLRGDTWSEGPTAAERLASLFLNPFFGKRDYDALEPDAQPIESDQARSAILFGPPGTSKTTLVRSLAAALNWQFVELHASDFVAEGLGEVQKTADKIFRQLMELDHTVVLFDEIDELVREREGAGTDTFGRFLTTSMLPKLAQLWDQRKVLYFVNTNHILYFDAAITRARRFDAVLSVPPPSFRRKKQVLEKRIERLFAGGPSASLTVAREAFEDTLKQIQDWEGRDKELGARELAKFILLRWDQLEELASHVAYELRITSGTAVDQQVLEGALRRIADRSLEKIGAYLDFLRDRTFERRDHERWPAYLIAEADDRTVAGGCIREENGQRWLICTPERWEFALPGYVVDTVPDQLAAVRITRRLATTAARVETAGGEA